MNLKEMIEVLQAAERGERIECCNGLGSPWRLCEPHWNFGENLYRIAPKPEPKLEEPLLGLATTRQLLEELLARAEVAGYADYRTVDEEP